MGLQIKRQFSGLGQPLLGIARDVINIQTIVRIAARVLRILKVIVVPRVWAKEFAVAKVIEFYIPTNFRRPTKCVPELQRGQILQFCPQTKKSA